MPNDSPARVRKPAVRADDEVDPRVARTTRALARALIGLIKEREFDAITVQDILDRAGVGRATFYAHYRNKQDVLLSSYEGVFAWLAPLVERPSPAGPRLFPVAEFLAHVGEEPALVDALRRDGLLDEMWALCADHAARMIARRLGHAGGSAPDMPRALVARMLAGALMEAIRWWQDHPAAATPVQVDAAFHEVARGVLRASAARELV